MGRYEILNLAKGVVSITNDKDGRPATDWMLYAKTRTRSKLQCYFRSKQRESF